MPFACKNVDGTIRLVNTDTGQVATTPDGKPRDGGGHDSPEACKAQAQQINNREKNSPQNNPAAAKRLRNA